MATWGRLVLWFCLFSGVSPTTIPPQTLLCCVLTDETDRVNGRNQDQPTHGGWSRGPGARARFYPCDVCVLTAYAVTFWDAAGSAVSSTSRLCDSEALAILGFTFGADPRAREGSKISAVERREVASDKCVGVPESAVRWDGLQCRSQEA